MLSRKYELEFIERPKKKEDSGKGVRYFLELVVKDLTDGKSYILAEYVFQPNGKNILLCYPKGLQWNRTADVYLILTAKNLGRWKQKMSIYTWLYTTLTAPISIQSRLLKELP